MQEKLFISTISSEKTQELLKDFIDKTKVNGAFITTKSGQLIDEYGFFKDLNILSLSAILSGIAASIEKMGNLLKENICEILIEGKTYKVFFKIFMDDYIFSCIFKSIKIGMIKVETIRITDELSKLFSLSRDKLKKDEINDIINRIVDNL